METYDVRRPDEFAVNFLWLKYLYYSLLIVYHAVNKDYNGPDIVMLYAQ
jgi:hypothetical protein